jgi:hypothetical protein
VCSTWFKLARLSARNCSAVYEFPQVLHLHFAFGLARIPALGLPEPLSLGRNAITRSPPHCRHFRLIMIYCRSSAKNSLVTIAHSQPLGRIIQKMPHEREIRGSQKKQICSKLNISEEWPGVS